MWLREVSFSFPVLHIPPLVSQCPFAWQEASGLNWSVLSMTSLLWWQTDGEDWECIQSPFRLDVYLSHFNVGLLTGRANCQIPRGPMVLLDLSMLFTIRSYLFRFNCMFLRFWTALNNADCTSWTTTVQKCSQSFGINHLTVNAGL